MTVVNKVLEARARGVRKVESQKIGAFGRARSKGAAPLVAIACAKATDARKRGELGSRVDAHGGKNLKRTGAHNERAKRSQARAAGVVDLVRSKSAKKWARKIRKLDAQMAKNLKNRR